MNELQTTSPTDFALVENPSLILFNADLMRALMTFAEVMAQSVVTVPKHLHGKPSDCLAITLQAMRWKMDPYIVAGKTHVVNGNLGYEAQLVVAVLKSSGAIKGRPHYEYQGDGPALSCRAGFIPAGEHEVVWTEWLSIGAIKVKNSPLWATNPKQQFGYLQARNWARLYAPDALLGVYTDDELLDSAGTAGDAATGAQHARGPQRKSATVPMVEEVPPNEQGPQDPEVTPPPAKPAANHANAGGISGGQVNYLRKKLEGAGIAEQSIADRFQVASIELLTAEAFDTIKAELLAMA
jgi:hypothetical protein